MRVRFSCGSMTLNEADLAEYWLREADGVEKVSVFDRTGDAVILYKGKRERILNALSAFSFARAINTKKSPKA